MYSRGRVLADAEFEHNHTFCRQQLKADSLTSQTHSCSWHVESKGWKRA